MKNNKIQILIKIFIIFGLSVGNSSATISYEKGVMKELTFDREVGEVFTSDSTVLELTPFGKKKVFINAKEIGQSFIRIKDRNGKILVSSKISVIANLSTIKKILKRIYPSLNIKLKPYLKTIVLVGKVPSPELSKQVAELVQELLEGDNFKVINKLDVDLDLQVMLKVKIVEVSRDISKSLGFSWGGITSKTSEAGNYCLGGFFVDWNSAKNFPDLITKITNGVAAGWKYVKGGLIMDILSVLNVLESEHISTVIAEPTLIALSGEAAKFTSSGEEPYQAVSATDSSIVETQMLEYGVTLNFTPTIISENLIKLNITKLELKTPNNRSVDREKVKEMDNNETQTTVEIANGQTFAISGFLKRNVANYDENNSILGNIPVLGNLFSRKSVNAKDKEIIVTITPYIIHPTKESVYFPTDGISKFEENDDRTNDNVQEYDIAKGVSKDYNYNIEKQ